MNASDPLAGLRDIHLPPAPGFWPPAPGWWLLGALLMGAVLLGLWRLRAYRRRRAPVRAALAALHALRMRVERGESDPKLAAELSAILRRAALARYPRSRVASLSGERWLEFLDRTGKRKGFRNGPGACLTQAPYAPRHDSLQDLDPALALCEAWIRER